MGFLLAFSFAASRHKSVPQTSTSRPFPRFIAQVLCSPAEFRYKASFVIYGAVNELHLILIADKHIYRFSASIF